MGNLCRLFRVEHGYSISKRLHCLTKVIKIGQNPIMNHRTPSNHVPLKEFLVMLAAFSELKNRTLMMYNFVIPS